MTNTAHVPTSRLSAVPVVVFDRRAPQRARAAGLPQRLKRCVAMCCDAQRRVVERCDAPRRVAYRDVDKSYASHRRPLHGAVARRLQDSAAAIKRAPSVYGPSRYDRA